MKSLLGLNAFLLLIPATYWLQWSGAAPHWIALSSALAIVPLARLLADATEALADHLGPTAGGLMNATFGNAPEIIIGYFALRQGLVDMVKSAITGSILGNLLVGIGLIFLAQLRRSGAGPIRYDLDAFRMHCGMLVLATFGLIIPSVFDFSTSSETEISLEISIVLLLMYLQSIVSTFLSVESVETDDALEILRFEDEVGDPSDRPSSPLRAAAVLAGATGLLAVMSETMTDALGPAAEQLGLSAMFVGVFLLALLGNVADLINVVRFSARGKVDLALGIMLGSSAQMALMVAPCLVFVGLAGGRDMNLLFSNYELLALIMTVTAVSSFLSAGQARARIGFSFLALYGMLGIGFYYAPG